MDRLGRRREELRERSTSATSSATSGASSRRSSAQERRASSAGSERSSAAIRRTPTRPDAEHRPGPPKMLRDVAAKRLDRLDALPRDVGERIRDLREYDFLDPEARERFDELVERLGKQVLDQFVAGMSDAIRSMTPEDLAANREMVRDLNELHPRADRRRETRTSASSWPSTAVLPGRADLDDIIEQLAERMAAMQSLMRSMTPEQRAELESMMEALLRDDRLLVDLAQLASNLDQLLPGGLGDRVPVQRRRAAVARWRPRRRSPGSRRWSGWRTRSPTSTGPATSPTIDRDQVRELMGDDARPRSRGARRPGPPARGGRLPDPRRRAARADAARHPADRPEGARRPVRPAAPRRVRRPSRGPGRAGRGARGDDQAVRVRRPVPPRPARDARRTRWRARRTRPARRGAGRGVRLDGRRLRGLPDRADDPDGDRAAGRHEPLDAAARLLPRRQEGRGRARHADPDRSSRATTCRSSGSPTTPARSGPGALAELSWHGYEYGTNLQHGLLLARRILARAGGGQQGDRGHHRRRADRPLRGRPGRVQLPADAARRSSETLREVRRCTKEGITINTFMLERSRALAEFVAHMTQLNRGRAFYATPERLGEYVLVDFVGRRTKRVGWRHPRRMTMSSGRPRAMAGPVPPGDAVVSQPRTRGLCPP